MPTSYKFCFGPWNISGYSADIAGRDFPLEEGVNFLPKPFEMEKFAQTIRQRLDGGLGRKG